MNRFVLSFIVLALPLTANATMSTDKMAPICATEGPGCMAYTLGGAERVWLAAEDGKKCDEAADKKALDTLTKAAKGKDSLYKTEKPEPAALALLAYLNKNNVKSCSLATRLSDIVAKCASKTVDDQTVCQAYVAGVLDMALAQDEIHFLNANKDKKDAKYVRPFCEKGKTKESMTNDEVMKPVGAYAQAKAKEADKIPASAGIVDALLENYSCKPAKAAKPLATTKKK